MSLIATSVQLRTTGTKHSLLVGVDLLRFVPVLVDSSLYIIRLLVGGLQFAIDLETGVQ